MIDIEERPDNIKLAGTDNGRKEEDRVRYQEPEELKWYEEAMILIAEAFFFITSIVGVVMVFYGMLRNPVYIGYGILALIPIGYFIYTGQIIVQVPEKKVFMLSAFKKYYKTLNPGLHFIVPLVMKVDRELTVAATKVFDIYLRTGTNKLEFKDGSVGVAVKVFCKAYNPYKLGYGMSVTDEEIGGIEQQEIDKGFAKLPENWMYFAATKIEAAARGVSGRYTIDQAIEARSVGKKGEEGEFKEFIIGEIQDEANRGLESYEIVVEQIAFSSIELSPELEKARNQIQIEEKGVEVKKRKLKQAQIDASIKEQEGVGERRRLDAIVGDTEIIEETEEGGVKIKKVVKKIPSGMTRDQAMRYDIAKDTAKNIDSVTVLSGGDEKSSIAMETAARFGASFGTGLNAVKQREKKEPEDRGKKEEMEEEKESKTKGGKKKTEEKKSKAGETETREESESKGYKEKDFSEIKGEDKRKK